MKIIAAIVVVLLAPIACYFLARFLEKLDGGNSKPDGEDEEK